MSTLNLSNTATFCLSSHTKRERAVTKLFATLCLAVLVSACGGGKKSSSGGDTYAKATSAQEACCEHAGPNRDSCLKEIVRVEDSAKESAANQATYACVVDHFSCDASTGHATQASAQAQLDCVQDLGQ
ncbi:MAG: hypothetical protein QM831_03980 [Kofleriaceae bacterium]